MNQVKEKYKELLEAVANSGEDPEQIDEDLDNIDSWMNAFGNYMQKIVASEISITALRFRLEGQELIDEVIEMDKARRKAHDSAIVAVSCLNKISSFYNAPCPVPFSYQDYQRKEDMGDQFSNRDLRDRVEEFAMEVVTSFADGRDFEEIKKSIPVIQHKEIMQEKETQRLELEDAILSGDDDAIKDAVHQLTNNPNNPSTEIQNEQNFDAIDEYDPETK